MIDDLKRRLRDLIGNDSNNIEIETILDMLNIKIVHKDCKNIGNHTSKTVLCISRKLLRDNRISNLTILNYSLDENDIKLAMACSIGHFLSNLKEDKYGIVVSYLDDENEIIEFAKDLLRKGGD